LENNLFNLNFYLWGVMLLYWLPALLNIVISIYVSLWFKKTRMNGFFSIFVLLLGIWQICEGLMKVSKTAKAAEEWNDIAGILLLFSIPFGILFILRFTGWHKKIKSNLVLLFLFLPGLILFILIEARQHKFTIIKSAEGYWVANPHPTFITSVIFLWICSITVFMVVLLWLFYIKKKENDLNRKQALLFALGFTVPVVAGIIGEAILPLLFGKDDIPVAAPLMVIFSCSSLVAIKKYKMLDFSPRHQWDKIIESMSDGLLIVDNEGYIMYSNEAFCRLTEYKFAEIKGKSAHDLLLTDDKTKKDILKNIADRKNDIPGKYEVEMKTKSGKAIWVLISGSPYKDPDGKIIGSIGIQTDITKLKETEKAMAMVHVGSWSLSFQTGVATWSEEALRIYGIPLSEKEQSFKNWISYIHPDDLDVFNKEIERSQSTLQDLSFKHRILWKDGTVKYIHSISKFEFNESGKPIGLYGICHDLTEQRKAEEALMESEERMLTFTNESLLSIYFFDVKTKKILYSNFAISELMGYSLEELAEIEIYDLSAHSKEDVDEQIAKVIEMKKMSNGERIWKRKDGKRLSLHVTSFYQNKNGREIIYVAAKDITESKKAEHSLEATNKELETFIYKASHDIRGPLASIMGLTNVSKLEVTDKTALNYLRMIELATKKLDYVLLELVKAMKIKGTEVFVDDIHFESLLSGVISRFEHTGGFARLNISTVVNVSNTFISNRFIIETILQNLIENTIKYQNPNNKNPFLKVSVSETPAGIVIKVEDNGIGIEKSLQSKVYDMYFRAIEDSKGSGLGLYLVKKSIEKLNGQIELESKQGEGTTFTIRLFSKL